MLLFEKFTQNKEYREISLSPYLKKALDIALRTNSKRNIEETVSDWCNKNLVGKVVFFKTKDCDCDYDPFTFKASKVLPSEDICMYDIHGTPRIVSLFDVCFIMYVKVKTVIVHNKIDPFNEDDWDTPTFD